MLDKLQRDDFARHLNEKFRLDLGDRGALDLELAETTTLGGTRLERAPFSVVFHGPGQPLLPQATYRLEHEQLGALEIFLVPIAARAGGIDYEAVFT